MDLFNIALGRGDAARAAGITEAQLTNWFTRYNLFPSKRQGTGTWAYFTFSDIMLLAGVRELVGAGMEPQKAADALRNYTLYGSFLHDGRSRWASQPGTFSLTMNADGRWVGVDGDRYKVKIELRTWPIFDEVFPRFVEIFRESPGRLDPEQVAKAIAEAEAWVESHRRLRWGE